MRAGMFPGGWDPVTRPDQRFGGQSAVREFVGRQPGCLDGATTGTEGDAPHQRSGHSLSERGRYSHRSFDTSI